MKTFTNYAAKAKQFLNLLQGYTKGIRMTAILILLLMGVSNAWAEKTVWIDVSDAPSGYTDKMLVHYWGGNSGDSYVSTSDYGTVGNRKIYKADIPDGATNWQVCRGDNNNKYNWQHAQTYSTNNKYYVKGWDNNGDGTKVIGMIKGGHIYFDNSTTSWTGNIQFVIGHNNGRGYSRTYEMTQVEHTQLWYVNLTDKENHEWNDATYYGFIASSDKFGDGEWGSGNLSNASKYTAAYTSTYSLNDGGTYYCKPSSATNGKSFTITYVNGYNAISKYNATQAAKLRNDITSSYATVNGTWPTTLKLKGTHLNGNGSSERNEISGTASSNAESNRVYGAVVTGKITHTYSTITGNYIFEGWGTGTTPSTTNATYEYNITANTTVYAFFTKAYTVTYLQTPSSAADAPTTSPSVTSGSLVASGTSVAFTAQAAKTGYTWKGWYDNNAGTGNALSTNLAYTRSITANTTIYAVYTTNTYSVKFDANGGSGTMSDQNFTYGTAQNLTANAFTRTGYTFAGWATSENGNKVYNDKQSVSNLSSTNGATVTLYAKWTPVNYTITYNTNGGNSIADKTYTIETETFDLPTPTKDGCTFVGWYDNEGLTGDKVTQIAKGSYGDKTFYAKWDAEKFTLEWDANGGTITTPGSPEGGEVEAGTPLKAPTVTKDHYVHTGWTPEEPTVMPDEDVTYIAQWTPKEYTITYNLNDGSGTMTPTTYTIESETFTLPTNPTKTGHTFAGWYANAELTGNDVTQIEKGSTGDKAYWAKWDVASYTINFDQQSGSDGTPSVTAQFGAKLSAITIPSRDGYLFDGYYTQTGGKGTKYYNADGSTTKTMPHNISTLYAKWIPYSQCIFFKNNLNWNNVYVYFYSSDNYWDGDKGTGSEKEKEINGSKAHYREFRDEMTNITGTDIWYLDYKTMATNVNATYASEIDNCTNIAFTKDKQYNYEFFDNTEVVRRGDFNHDMQLFVPLLKTKQTADEKNKHDGKVTKYYSSGIWMKYNSTESGYDWRGSTNPDDANQWNKSHSFTTDNPGGYSFKASVTFDNVQTHYFKIHNNKGDWYGNGGTMDQNNCTNWTFGADNGDNAKITPTVTGTYIFTIYLGDGEVKVSLDYPLSVGDYRLAYKDKTENSHHPGHYLKKRSTSQTDTVSFFIHHQDQKPEIIVEKCTKITDGVPTWAKVEEITINPAVSITESGVYNFYLQQQDGKALPTLVQKADPYKGNYYIRTDAAAGGWDSFRQAGNKMTYSSYASSHTNFNHYFCSWITKDRNVKFTIANDYSLCISDTLDGDAIITAQNTSTGCLPADANVRFGWNSTNNELERAYIAGSGVVSDRFLVLIGDNKLTDLNDHNFNISDLNPNEAIFADKGNWIYQLDAKAGKGASIQLIATYNENVQTFFNTSSVALAEEGNNDTYPVRFIYDFKTNNLMAAWLLLNDSNTIDGGSNLNANMLLLRKHHDQSQQIQLNDTLKAVGTAYGVITFDKYFLNNRDKNGNVLPKADEKSIYERALYWISFPFDVRIRDVFGFGEYMDTWIMEYYDGEARAKNGAWVDSESYWTYITDLDYVLEKGVGYVLCLDLDKMGYESSVFEHTDEVSLYFPSAQAIGTINTEQAESVTVPAHECTISRPTPNGDRTIADANWNVIGVPRFINLDIKLTNEKQGARQDDVIFYYEYIPATDDYAVEQSTGPKTFQTMQAYMVQYAGTIDWWEMATWETPQQIAARRNADAGPKKVSLNLEFAQDDLTADKTFIQLQEEGATADFDMNKDLCKILNAGANIYTIVGESNVLTAGNVMPMSECVVPVGVKVATEGEYTFRMPDGTEGMVVELIDYYTNTRTNLLLFDYTVNLSAGTCNDRFALHIQPSKSGVTTNIDQINGGSMHHEGVQKYLIDGKLIIRTAEGEVFDAQGHRL